ncbi:uncharacterized protein LOC110273845 isoform X2 [Arachis duranensis]|uniref:Uncharacterized protein LOC110273845 isoform X2 n=1 Tax=Arachis duranensis TaxID=130453 RepID=A0A9C6TCD2_ARADU|nr:uncharacterized protein LOC110273845 isoform X2 [Arachis duranensis]
MDDPLANYWGLSLFPQPTGVTASSSSKPYDPNYDLDSIHNHLRSRILQILADELKAVICENPGLFDSKISSDPACHEENDNPACHEENDVVAEEVLEFPRNRRPALGLSQSVESLIPRQDLDKPKDPAEFFLAHERLERKTMHLFLSDEEFVQCSGDTATVAAKADACIRSLLQEFDALRARADASDQQNEVLKERLQELEGKLKEKEESKVDEEIRERPEESKVEEEIRERPHGRPRGRPPFRRYYTGHGRPRKRPRT